VTKSLKTPLTILVCVDKHVVALDIAVHNITAVQILESLDQLHTSAIATHVMQINLRDIAMQEDRGIEQWAVLVEHVRQTAAGDGLHEQPKHALALLTAEELDDVAVLEVSVRYETGTNKYMIRDRIVLISSSTSPAADSCVICMHSDVMSPVIRSSYLHFLDGNLLLCLLVDASIHLAL
jgi:hypothetical protein